MAVPADLTLRGLRLLRPLEHPELLGRHAGRAATGEVRTSRNRDELPAKLAKIAQFLRYVIVPTGDSTVCPHHSLPELPEVFPSGHSFPLSLICSNACRREAADRRAGPRRESIATSP